MPRTWIPPAAPASSPPPPSTSPTPTDRPSSASTCEPTAVLPIPSESPTPSAAHSTAQCQSSSSPPSAPLPLSLPSSPDDFPDWNGRFDVRRRLGYGAFSSVWLAYDRSRPLHHPHYTVALKRIKPLSTAVRILDEARFIDGLAGQAHVVQLLELLVEPTNHRSHPTLVLSYIPHSTYKSYLSSLTLRQVQLYLAALLRAFAHLHSAGCQGRAIIHRDLKPANFLYHWPPTVDIMMKWAEDGCIDDMFRLVDFGLAHVEHDHARRARERGRERARRRREAQDPPAQSPSPQPLKHRKAVSAGALTSSSSLSSSAPLPPASLPPLGHASTLGTRGFRAPEILLRHPRRELTTAIDLWNVGVMLLSILCQRYPVFDRSDSEEALMQIAALMGEAPQLGDTSIQWTGVSLRRVGEDYDADDSSSALPPPSDYPSLDEYCWLSCDRHWPPDAFDLLRRLLHFDPNERATAEEALRHPFLTTDYDEKSAAWHERRRTAEANELRWQQRKERRELRWKRRERAKSGVGSALEKENVHNGLGRYPSFTHVLEKSERSVFTSRAELGEEGTNATPSAISSASGGAMFFQPSAMKRRKTVR